jgi:hypothetical protein
VGLQVTSNCQALFAAATVAMIDCRRMQAIFRAAPKLADAGLLRLGAEGKSSMTTADWALIISIISALI